MNRKQKLNEIRNKLASKEPSIGSWMQIPSSSIAEIMGQSGYDWVAVDMEHGSIGHHQLPDLFRALELGDTLPLARIAEGTPKDCKQALDAGAGGVIVPMIKSAEQLISIRDSCRWPPAGNRGVAFSRANLFGNNFESYIEEAQSPLLVAMIEDIKAVDTLDEILDVHGLDAILIGPYDLSASMGKTSMFDDVNFCKVIDLIVNKAKSAAVPVGIHLVKPSSVELNKYLSSGYTFIAYSIDAVFLSLSAKFK